MFKICQKIQHKNVDNFDIYLYTIYMANKYVEIIKKYRNRKGISQAEFAELLGISRTSYIAVEQGKRPLELDEAQKLAETLEISLDELINGELSLPEIIFEKSKNIKKVDTEENGARISVPQEKVEKFKQVLLYILAKIGGKPNIGQTVLYKLLYFIDFDYYEKYEEQLIGARYIKNTHGPTPVIFSKIIKELEKEKKIEEIKSKFYKYDQTKYLINPEHKIDLSTLSAEELSHIDWEIERLSDMTANKISELSHKDTPWKIAKEKEQLDYEFVFYRTEETSVREYEPL